MALPAAGAAFCFVGFANRQPQGLTFAYFPHELNDIWPPATSGFGLTTDICPSYAFQTKPHNRTDFVRLTQSLRFRTTYEYVRVWRTWYTHKWAQLEPAPR